MGVLYSSTICTFICIETYFGLRDRAHQPFFDCSPALERNYLPVEFDWLVPNTGLQSALKGLIKVTSGTPEKKMAHPSLYTLGCVPQIRNRPIRT